MTTSPLFPGFDGLMTLSRREGVDIRPTLLRVLTDLYVQARAHSRDEERQFVELTSRLIDEVDDATRAAVQARLAIYPGTPIEVLKKLGLKRYSSNQPLPVASEIPSDLPPTAATKTLSETQLRMASNLPIQPKDAAEISDMFSRANSSERALILYRLNDTPLQASARIPTARARRAIETLEMAACAADIDNFTLELSETLILPWRVAAQVIDDPGGEPLACAAKTLAMPSPVFQRVLLWLKPELRSSANATYWLLRLYDRLSERSALIMLAAWRGSTMAVTRAKFQPGLYDDERNRARLASTERLPAAQQAGTNIVKRTGSEG